MAPLASASKNRLVETVHQSAPVDVTQPYDATALRGKTVLVTGGSSGLGAAFARRWAAHGAHLIIADINDAAGAELVAELRTTNTTTTTTGTGTGTGTGAGISSSSQTHHHHFIHVDVADWQSQAAMFQEAVRLSPHGELDAVVASAGTDDRYDTATGRGFENPTGLDRPNPPAPSLRCLEVNLIGMMYTAHLALFWLARDGDGDGNRDGPDPPARSDGEKEEETTTTTTTKRKRDRHFLMVGSSAGLYYLPGMPEYVTSKHGVTGLFRSLRTLSYRQGIRVNLLCPYFVDTPILPNRAVALLSGMRLTGMDDTVDAATRFMAAEPSISGRALVVGPRMPLLRKILPDHEVDVAEAEAEAEEEDERLREDDVIVPQDLKQDKGQAVWECYAHDYDTVDYFFQRYTRILNTMAQIRGWIGFLRDLFHTLFVRKGPEKSTRV